MTVGEILEKLKEFPEDTEVKLETQYEDSHVFDIQDVYLDDGVAYFAFKDWYHTAMKQ